MTQSDTDHRDHGTTTSGNVRACTIVFLSAGVLFALFGSDEMVSMSYDLPENPWTVPVVTMAEAWHTQMQAIGTAGLSQAVRDMVTDLRTIGWP